MNDRRRLIEDYIPIDAISEEARPESASTQARGYLSKALISTLHRWWARRPLVACRAAVYAALVPADQFANGGGDEGARKRSDEFLSRLCRRDVGKKDLETARKHILEANEGKPPVVLDPFAGGGSIPLEAARLGCESIALELNPVAHVVELATLVYPAQFGQRLVGLVEKWAGIVYKRAFEELKDLYPPIPDPRPGQMRTSEAGGDHPPLTPVAYLWTRTVPCKRCGKQTPLYRQTWLRKKSRGFVALRPIANADSRQVAHELLESSATTEREAVATWGFDPTDLSVGGATECPFCKTALDNDYVRECGAAGVIGVQPTCVVASRDGERGKVYVTSPNAGSVPSQSIVKKLEALSGSLAVGLGSEPLPPPGTLGFRVQPYGFNTWDQLFTDRQLVALLTFCKHIRAAHHEIEIETGDRELAKAVATYLAFIMDKVAERGVAVCRWFPQGEKIQSPIAEGKMPMVWDFPESNPLSAGSGSWRSTAGDVLGVLIALVRDADVPCRTFRGSATSLPFDNEAIDAIITDPPYYDSVPYSHLSDFFYVWLKRSVGHLYPEHFAGAASPKRNEAVMEPAKHQGDRDLARIEYERLMAEAFTEANRVLKPGGPMVCVYAHKTTAGWATLVDALRSSGFMVTEAWPMDTESPARQRSHGSSALATSIFIVTRKRDNGGTGSYEADVRPELDRIVRERVHTLWDMGISGADLVIACVGAGLRAFTKYAKVEYANGEPVPSERFLAEVEAVVLEEILNQLSEKSEYSGSADLSGVDAPTRCYILWRYTYRRAPVEAGEAIVFANGTHVELDGQGSLSQGAKALVERKRKGSEIHYELRDYTSRGEYEELGMPNEFGQPAPLIDALHRTLWLLEYRPAELIDFLQRARPNLEQLRMVAQVLAGPVLKGGELPDISPSAELAALSKLTSNWRSVMEHGIRPSAAVRTGGAEQPSLMGDDLS